MFRKQKGITLIALVITIIVLLILAGVSINLVVGEGGILGKAQNAVSASRAGTAKEEIGLAWSACETEYMEEWVTNQGIDKSTFFTKEKLNANLGGKGTVTTVTYNETEDSTLKYASTDGNLVYDMKISSTGQVSIVGEPTVSDTPVTPDVPVTPEAPSGETLLSQITSANYGDKVIYTANGVSDWKILYKDTTNVYIVASDYLAHGGDSDTSKIVSGTGMTKADTYRACWYSIPASANTTNHVAKFSPVTAETKAWTGNYSTYPNGKCVSTLLDTTLWSAYASGVGGESAIGSPTLNMFVASWNEKYPSDKIYCNKDSANGYYFGTSSAPKTYGEDLSGKTGYGNTLYYPYQSATSDSCYGYWLASPSAYNASGVMRVRCGGYVDFNDYNNYSYGVRPVVSLSSSIKGTSTTTDGVTTWTLSN